MPTDPSSDPSNNPFAVRAGRGFRFKFTQVPQWVMLHPVLSDLGFRVYCILLSRVNTERLDNKVWPKQQSIADMLNKHRNTISKIVLDELAPLDLVDIEVERYGTNNSRRRNVYLVHEQPPPGWTGCASVTEWDDEYGKTAGQPGRTLDSASGGTAEKASGGNGKSASGRTVESASGRTAACAGNKTNEELDEGRTTLAATASETATPDVAPELVERLCKTLADAVKGNGVRRPKITYAWREAAAQLLTPDEEGHAYTVEEIEGGIAWAQADTFWASKTTTMAKFAKHFDQMMIQASKAVPRPRTAPAAGSDEGDLKERRDAAMDAAEAQMETALKRPLTTTEVQALRERIMETVQ